LLVSQLGLPPTPVNSYNSQKITNALQQIDPEAAAKAAMK
jgi:hypothetical protein